MVTALLSPCLYIENNEIKNLTQLFEVLDFTNSFLDAKLGFSASSILAIENWFSFPQYKQSIYNQFSTLIVPLLKKILCNYTSNEFSNDDIDYKISDKKYIITDAKEFNNLLQYILCTKADEEYLLFVGKSNIEIDNFLNLYIRGIEIKLPIIKELLFDKTGNYNQYIKESVKNYNEPFPCKDLCLDIGKQILETGNKSLYKKYGKIIAERNGFLKLPYSSKQYKNVPYYIRRDKEYVICIDTLHGTFEVFKKTFGDTYKDFRGEYDFSCNKIEDKNSSSSTHICYK